MAEETTVAVFSEKPLHVTQAVPDKNFDWVKFSRWTGISLTALAMVPQAVLAALLSDYFLNKHSPYLRAFIDPVVGFAGGIGKYMIVHFYNNRGFEEMGTEEYWKNVFTWSKWSWKDIANLLWSLTPSLEFAYIGKLSFEGIAKLLSPFNYNWTNKLASGLNYWPYQIPGMISPFICNLRGFPHIHNGGIELIKQALYYCAENPEYRKLAEEISSKLDAIRRQIKNLYESGDPEKIAQAKQILETLDLENKSIDALRDELLKRKIPQQFIENPETWRMFITKNLTGITAIAAVIWGFYNFPFLAANMVIQFASFIGLAGPIMSWVTSLISYIVATKAYLSMSAMSAGVYHTVSDFFDWLRDHHIPVDILSTGSKILNHLLTFILCILGVAPNVYQSLVLTGEPVSSTIAAGFASAAVEYGGFTALNRERQIESKIKENEDAKLFYEADKKLLEASNLSNCTEAEIHDLADLFYDAPELRDEAPEVEAPPPLLTAASASPRATERTPLIIENGNKDKRQHPPQYRSWYSRFTSAFWCCREPQLSKPEPLNINTGEARAAALL